MFNDKFGLTQAVLNGRKTQTRRIVPQSIVDKYEAMFDPTLIDAARYDVGEVVAVAQSYCDIADYLEDCRNATCAGHYEKQIEKASWYVNAMYHPGFRNKMFVESERMIHKIGSVK